MLKNLPRNLTKDKLGSERKNGWESLWFVKPINYFLNGYILHISITHIVKIREFHVNESERMSYLRLLLRNWKMELWFLCVCNINLMEFNNWSFFSWDIATRDGSKYKMEYAIIIEREIYQWHSTEGIMMMLLKKEEVQWQKVVESLNFGMGKDLWRHCLEV